LCFLLVRHASKSIIGRLLGWEEGGWWWVKENPCTDLREKINKQRACQRTENMGELVFIGLGLYDENDISVKGLKAAKQCNRLFAEFYTAKLTGTSLEKLQKAIGNEITVLNREDFEKGDIIIHSAGKEIAGVLVAGDPMTATTHVALRLRAIKEGIHTRIITGASIITAAPALLGLHIYKFGRTTTLAYPEANYFPTSPYDVIKSNQEEGLHTLVLLDINEEEKRYMRGGEALKLLLKMEEEKGQEVVSQKTLVCVIGGVGSNEPVVRAGRLADLLEESFGEGLHCIIIPGKLHFMEAEALVEFGGAPKEILESE
jgi:diphthine synthase